MAKYYKRDSTVHQSFERLFETMRGLGIIMDIYGANRFLLDERKHPSLKDRERVVEIVESESGEPFYMFPPICEFRVRICDS